jgi:hypothetical protein
LYRGVLDMVEIVEIRLSTQRIENLCYIFGSLSRESRERRKDIDEWGIVSEFTAITRTRENFMNFFFNLIQDSGLECVRLITRKDRRET